MEDSPVNAAHAFANAAEELKEKEQWGQAMQAHFRAAEQFALAINYTSEPEAIRSLKIQYTDQTRQGKEVQRRLAKQAPPQEKLSPSSSNRTRRPSSSTSSKSNVNNPQVKNNSEQRIQQNQSRQNSTLSTQPAANSGARQINSSSDDRLSSDFLKTNAPLKFSNDSTSSKLNPVLSDSVTSTGISRTSTMSSMTPSMMEGSSSSEKIEESYMMLKGNNESTDDDEADPFNKFWDIVEGLVQKISNPVAFATVPLNGAYSRASLDQNTIQPSLPIRYNTVNENIVDDSKVEELSAAMMESFYIIPKDQRPNSRTGKPPQTSSSSSPSTPIPSESKDSTKTLEEYSIENKQLKTIIDKLSKRMLSYEKAAEENNMLKSSILQFKNDVQKQAKRIKVKQTSPESSTVGNAHLQKRIKELEEENRVLKSERDKQNELIVKYKDRWEKLKESAKKKRVNKQVEASQMDSSSHQN
ncbi:1577_t:CDS:10 [Funneliformis geosporum]|nr:1577_t:CDS:10 [Funneliformis geosporum]